MTLPASLKLLQHWGRWRVAFVFLTMVLALSGGAWAQQCSSGGFGIPFGTVSTSGNTDVTASLPFNCQSNASDTYYKVCLFFPGGAAPIAGINPKRMQDYNGHYIDYNVYSDAARTQIIGPPPTGSGYPLYVDAFMVPGGYGSPLRLLPVYGRVPPVPAGTAAGSYQAQLSGITLKYAWSNAGPPLDCFQSPGDSAVVGFSGVTATVSNTCRIAIGQANDLNFGSVNALTSTVNGTSTITLSCPSNTSWKLGLNNGQNALSGQRRMAGPTPDVIGYELYSDAGRTKRWGNGTAGDPHIVNGSGASQANPTVLTVYGQVPAQEVAAPGDYLDTITLTLTY